MDILLVEDNETIIQGLIYAFNKQNMNLVYRTTVKNTIEYLNNHDVELIILDVSLPDGDGFTLYDKVIKDKNIPVIFLTAKDDEEDVVHGLTLGAEDYMTKPFSTKELLVRVNKTLLRNKKSSLVKVKDISFDLDKMILKKNDKAIKLSSLEMNIVYLLFLNKGKVVRKLTILDKIWELTGNDVDDHTVAVYIKRIRDKMDSDIIKTIKGVGYRIDEE